jgi:probable HAF family extracellular repeat protein
LGAALLVGTAAADPLYSLTNLGTLDGSVTVATGINSVGQVTGYSSDVSGNSEAFLYSGGAISQLGPTTCCSEGLGINDLGQVVGTMTLGGGQLGTTGPSVTFQAVTFSGSSATVIHPPGSFQNAAAVGISNTGAIAVTTFSGAVDQAVSYIDNAGTFTNIGSIGGPLASFATAINSVGLVVGYSGTGSVISDFRHGFIYEGGTITDLGNLGERAATVWRSA